MKRTPEARSIVRGLIQHNMEHADMVARALEDGHISDEHRAMCHAVAMRSLDHAAEMQDMYRSVWLGDKPSQSVIVDTADVGMEFAAPAIADGPLKARFAEVSAKVGKLPRSLRSIVKADLGVDDVEDVELKLMNLKGIQERFATLQTEHSRGVAAVEKLATDKLINEAEEDRLVSPAEVKRMRGLDPATDAVSQPAWGKAKVERFLEERRASGPIADIVRPGAVRTADAAMQQIVNKPSLVRFGNSPVTSSPAEVNALASQIAANLPGIKLEQIMGHYGAAETMPSASNHPALRNAKGL